VDLDARTTKLLEALIAGHCPTPFDVLGAHPEPDGGSWVVRAFLPWASAARVLPAGGSPVPMRSLPLEGVFEARLPAGPGAPVYRLDALDPSGRRIAFQDPYRFPPCVDELRVRAFLDGREHRLHEVLGAHLLTVEDVAGTLFAVWAPRARAVSLIGTMNGWDGRLHAMRPRGDTGVWEIFLPDVGAGTLYKYRIHPGDGGAPQDKADPVGASVELRPATASRVAEPPAHVWTDRAWMADRAARRPEDRPMSVYEVHLGSWRRTGSGGWLGYRELAETLLPYVLDLGFTHVELMPVMEHPLDESWGYQTVGYFAPTSRYGGPDDLRAFVDRAHELGLGVLLDWAPAHFPDDAHGLVRFDGTALFEHPDPHLARHPDWGTLVFDYGRPEVRAFLISSAICWLDRFHVDGFRVDAVASMLYLDYSRAHGEWTPNEEGGREDRDAVRFLRELTDAVHDAFPGALVIAEESTAWPGVSHGTDQGGLGFDQKWNLGWMHDSLEYFGADPLFRSGRHDLLTFSLTYAFSERFVLPLSHDEVVHGKRSLLTRMPGDYQERFANLRLLFGWQWLHPGKKLLFMGGELGQWDEWNVGDQLAWALTEYPNHRGIQHWVRDLNRAYASRAALHRGDHRADGFEWIDCDDAARSVSSWIRWGDGEGVVVVANFTPVDREGFQLPVPFPGRYRIVLDSDAEPYGGQGRSPREDALEARSHHLMGRDQILEFTLPGLTLLALEPC
jgi:1,4-alpha-glucan branching enzyme